MLSSILILWDTKGKIKMKKMSIVGGNEKIRGRNRAGDGQERERPARVSLTLRFKGRLALLPDPLPLCARVAVRVQ